MDNNMMMQNEMQETPQELVAHFQMDEIEALSELMGGIKLFPGLENVPVYDLTPLDEILGNPEVLAALNAELQNLSQENMPHMAEGGHLPANEEEFEQIRGMGRGGDTELAIITPKLEGLFDGWLGRDDNINPETGLKEYWNPFKVVGDIVSAGAKAIKTVARVAAPIVGAYFGGPVGAALASAATTKLTGGNWNDAARNAAMSAALSYASPHVGGMFGNTGGRIGDALGGYGATQNAAGAAQGVLNNSLGQGAAGAAGNAAAGGGGFLDSIINSKWAGPAAILGAGGMLFKGYQHEKKMQESQAAKAAEEHQRALKAARDQHGFNDVLPEIRGGAMTRNPEQQSGYDLARGVEHPNFIYRPNDYNLHKAQGGPIVGPGTATSDSIPKDIEEGSFIMSNKDVKNFGHGSTQKGFASLSKLLEKIPDKEEGHNKGGAIKAMLSNGEFEIPRSKVTGLGNGNNNAGATKFNKIRKKLKSSPKGSGGYLAKISGRR